MSLELQPLTYARISKVCLPVISGYLIYESFRLAGIDMYVPEPTWRNWVNKVMTGVGVILAGTQMVIAATLAF